MTDHAVAIEKMRQEAALTRDHESRMLAGREQDLMRMRHEFLECGAALLEVHDATGISLDDWTGPRELVESCLRIVGEGPLQYNYA